MVKTLTFIGYAMLGPITGFFTFYAIKYIRLKRYAMASICIAAIVESLAFLAGMEVELVDYIRHY